MSRSPKDYLEEARSPATPVARLRELARAEWQFVRAAVARNPGAPPDVLAALVPTGNDWRDEDIAVALAERSDTPPDVLRQLARRFGSFYESGGRTAGFDLGFALCANPSVPLDALAEMLRPDRTTPHFRKKVAARTCRRDVLQMLSGDVSAAVQKSARATMTGSGRRQ